METRRRWPKVAAWEVVLLVRALALLALALSVAAHALFTSRDIGMLAGVSVGMTVTDVLQFLGPPDAWITDPAEWDNEPWRAYRAPRTPIGDHVLAYRPDSCRAIYVYVDRRGTVTCVYCPEERDGR